MKIKDIIKLAEAKEWYSHLELISNKDLERNINDSFNKSFKKRPNIKKYDKTRSVYSVDGTEVDVHFTWDGKFGFYVEFRTKGNLNDNKSPEFQLMNEVVRFLKQKGDFMINGSLRSPYQKVSYMSLDANEYQEYEG